MNVLSEQWLARVSALIAGGGCVLLYLESRRRQLGARRFAVVGGLFAVLAVAAYFHFFMRPSSISYHRWEMFHYYVGARYQPELGYGRLYRCAAVADAETGGRDAVLHRRMRDLKDDTLVEASTALEDPSACKRAFSPERWQAFKKDIAFFRKRSGQHWWDAMQTDHGYNPSPVWTLGGRALASLAPASDRWLGLLALVDPVLMGAAIAALWWAFGGRVAALAVVFWGTQAASPFGWTGGGFLRQDWLFLAVASAALMRKRHFFWAGFTLAWAGLLRVFPVLLWGGPLVVMAAYAVRKRTLAKEHRRLLWGGVCAAALLVPLAGAVVGPHSYAEFGEHIAMHASRPSSNRMGLRTLFSVVPEARLAVTLDPTAVDPVEQWTNARKARWAELRPLFALCALVLVGFFVRATARVRTTWVALGMSLSLVVILTEPACYYYSIWLLAAPLARARRSLEMALLALAATGQFLILRERWMDDRFVALAALYVLFGVLLIALFSRRPRRPPRRVLVSE
ncbi:MAG: hypothetical protein KC776_10880 [Myxococcales bacterium]|nr:hypothetical protein [Myxococcales bacterium]MCB9581696.1 hypothetical protein [Polyangiaceae bacterium]